MHEFSHPRNSLSTLFLCPRHWNTSNSSSQSFIRWSNENNAGPEIYWIHRWQIIWKDLPPSIGICYRGKIYFPNKIQTSFVEKLYKNNFEKKSNQEQQIKNSGVDCSGWRLFEGLFGYRKGMSKKEFVKEKCELLLFGWECHPYWYKFSHVIELFILDAFVDLFITLCIVVNTVFMALDHAEMDPTFSSVLACGNLVSRIFWTSALLAIKFSYLFQILYWSHFSSKI